MIKIVSGSTVPVGSTIALVQLCNQLNQKGHDCVLYGPDHWHLDQCRAASIADFQTEPGDTLIVQGIQLFSVTDLSRLPDRWAKPRKRAWLKSLRELLAGRLPGRRRHPGLKLILSCQEEEASRLRRSQYTLFDRIHLVSAAQIPKRSLAHDHFICPNFCDPLVAANHKPKRVAGVIGSIRPENRTDRAIEKALQEGMEKVVLYGYLYDPIYYYRTIEPLTRKYPGRIQFAGFVESRQKMYDSVSDVYCHPRKPWSLVEKECRLTGTRYHGPVLTGVEDAMTNDRIADLWKRELEK